MVLWTLFILQPIGKASHTIILIFPFLNCSSMFNMLAIKNLHLKITQAITLTNFKIKNTYLGKVTSILMIVIDCNT